MTVARVANTSDDVVTVEPVYTDLRKLFLNTGRAIDDLTVLLKKFSIRLAHQSIVQLFVRKQWEIKADNEFSMAMGTDTALATQNYVHGIQNSVLVTPNSVLTIRDGTRCIQC